MQKTEIQPNSLDTAIELAIKIRPQTLKGLHSLGLVSIGDALKHFPYRHEDFSDIKKISELKTGERSSVKAKIKQIKKINGFRGSYSRAEAVISDDTDSMKVVWFNQPYLADQFAKGDEIYLAGIVGDYHGPQFNNPIYEKVNISTEQVHTARMVPIYSLKSKIPARTFRALLFELLPYANQFTEVLPLEIVESAGLMPRAEAIKELHFPSSIEKLEQTKKRMAFEEIFFLQCAVEEHKYDLEKSKAFAIKFKQDLTAKFAASLPFELTAEQKKAAWEIFLDLEKTTPMNRLLEGDVGSGKTLVALITALGVLTQNYQTAFLCPTEILAEQHYNSALKYFADYPYFSIILLTSKKQFINGHLATKKNLLEEIAHGGPQLVIGTHATIQDKVKFDKLAYVIIDEQHRFGVDQRANLQKKQTGSTIPHLLSMTATPIPRTLQLSIYGDLQISRITKLPSGRKPVITAIIGPTERLKAYKSIAKQVQEGRQIFVVTPLITPKIQDEEEAPTGLVAGARIASKEAKSAEQEAEALKKVFPKFKIGLLHGKLSAPAKDSAMRDFLENKTQILVSTTVIEVGVDVPNASVMVIENADRFGLAQLHQLRGRVGRSADHQSFCLLFTENENPEALDRLQKVVSTNNGFELAEMDLQLRGSGNVYGLEQSGIPRFIFYNISDSTLTTSAKSFAHDLVYKEKGNLSKFPELKNKVEEYLIHLE